MLPSKNLQVDAGLDIGDLTVEDLVVHRSHTRAELYDSLLHFVAGTHRQGAGECKGDCNEKSDPRLVYVKRDDPAKKNTDRERRGRRGR